MKILMGALLLLLLLVSAHARAQSGDETKKIDYLIDSIAQLRDARFVRNGSEYDAAQAADHLRLKLNRAGDHVRSAEDFIVYCATMSSLSKKPYQIRFADGRTINSADFLHERLAAYLLRPLPASAPLTK